MSRRKKKHVDPPELFQTLSAPPDGSWSQGAFYHGTRIGLVVLLAVAITILFPSESPQRQGVSFQYQVGDVVMEDVAAEVGFDIPRDPAEVARERSEIEAAIAPVFLYDAGTQSRVEDRLNQFFDQIQEAVQTGGRTAVEEVLEAEGFPGLVGSVDTFLNTMQLQRLREASLDLVREFLPLFLDSQHEEDVLSAGEIRVSTQEGVDLGTRSADELIWGTGFYTAARQSLDPSTSEFRDIVVALLPQFFRSPYSLDEALTIDAVSLATSNVPTTDGSVVEGEFVVSRGKQIGPEEIRRLRGYDMALQAHLQAQGLQEDPGRDWASLFGKFLFNLLLLGVFGGLLFFYRAEVYGSFRWILLLASLVFVYFLMAAGISSLDYPSELLPIAFVVLPVAILWDGRMALILALVLGLLSGAQEPFNQYPIMAFTLIGGAAAALSARAVRRRSQTWIFIAVITLGYALTTAAFGLMGTWQPGGILLSILFGAMNATISAILAMGFMPVFEWFTGITTDQTLLEWADPNRPLLKSLSLEASGTYAHTINVANLAEAAATAIGANGLLARVGVYYHDVGKMLKPQYFVENQPGGRNPHDKLKPHTSAAIVKEHVVEGERMARDEGVPDVIARFIPEHHGTQLIGFFYERAKEESEEAVNEDDFRYPGPKPRSKETAISMLADSVESATRVLHDASPERIQELVRTIVDGKIRDGQLSESPLTLGEIGLIEAQFVKVVGGMFHHRLDYPATKHITDATKEDSPEPSADSGQDSEAPSAAGEELPSEEPRGRTPKEEQLPLTPPEDPPGPPDENGR